jgi:LemA protein
MRRTSPVLWIVLGFLVILLFLGCGSYNGLVQADETVKQSWGNVQSAYQRRADLIPNLVETVKGEASFERGTLNDVISARARATSVNVNPENLTQENIQQFQQAQGQLSGALSRLLVTVEQYPTLRANDAFRDLQRQLEGTENRINTERNRFNEAVRPYNVKVRSFPTNIFAGMMGFQPRPPFEADPGAQNAPKVNFGTGNQPSVNFDTTR